MIFHSLRRRRRWRGLVEGRRLPPPDRRGVRQEPRLHQQGRQRRLCRRLAQGGRRLQHRQGRVSV